MLFILSVCIVFANNYQLGLEAYSNEDNETAITYFEKACDKRNSDACYKIGLIYFQDGTIEKNPLKANRYFDKACEFGSSQGCLDLGTIYGAGLGVKTDYFKAKQYYKKACDNNNASGCFLLGELYEDGLGVRQNLYKARILYQKAFENGHKYAYTKFVYLMNSIKSNYGLAKIYYEEACKNKEASECTSLGKLYEFGKGVEQDYQKAKMLFGKACDNGHQVGCDKYKELNIKGY